jgi:hypothetical protein
MPPPRRSEMSGTNHLVMQHEGFFFKSQCSFLLGAFSELRKATISFVMPVRLSVRMKQIASHWTHFDEI